MGYNTLNSLLEDDDEDYRRRQEELLQGLLEQQNQDVQNYQPTPYQPNPKHAQVEEQALDASLNGGDYSVDVFLFIESAKAKTHRAARTFFILFEGADDG